MRRCAALGAALAAACSRAPPPPPAPLPPAQVVLSEAGQAHAQVRTVRLTADAFAPQLRATAVLEADPQAIARVGAQMAGRVAALDVRLGDTVRAGQSLLQIETVELHHVSTEYLLAIARAREAADVHARQQQLVGEHVGAVQELRRAEAAAQAATATLHETEEHLHFLGLDDRAVRALRQGDPAGPLRSVLRAPMAGRIEVLSAALGQVLTGTEVLLTIMQLDRVWAVLHVYERDLPEVAVGAAVQLQVAAYGERNFAGTVASIGDLVDVASRSAEVRSRIDNPERLLKPGMSGTAAIALRGDGRTLWLPSTAVQPHGGGAVAFVAVGPRTYEARPVEVGPERSGYVPLRAGIAAGTEVVVQGALTLRGALEQHELQED